MNDLQRRNRKSLFPGFAKIGAIFGVTLIGVMVLVTGTQAAVRSSANYTMNKDVLDSGGGSSSSANYQLDGSIGQSSPVGPATSANFRNISGYFPALLLNVVRGKNDLVVNIPGTGVTVLFNNNTSSTLLHADTAEAIGVADVDANGEDDVIVSFVAGSGPGGTGGTFISRNRTPLVLLDTNIAEQIASGNLDGAFGDDLLLNSGAAGLALVLNDTGIIPFVPAPTEAIAIGDVDNSGLDDLVFSIIGFGTAVLKDFTTVDVLDTDAANVLAVADMDNNGEGDVVASFPAGTGPGGVSGTYISRNQGALVLLDANSAEEMAVGSLDGADGEDLLIDLGAPGLFFDLNDTGLISFIPVSTSAIAIGDTDDSGLEDMFMSIPTLGTTVLKDFATFEVLDPVEAVDLATGNVDGN